VSSARLSEAAVAAPVAAWFRDLGFDTFEEVSLGLQEARADLVAVRGRVLIVVEAKASFGLRVLEQASKWTADANRVYLVAPSVSAFGIDLAQRLGVGVLRSYAGEVRELGPAPLRRSRSSRLERALHPAQRTEGRAGSCGGGYSTPFSRTCSALLEVVREMPGAPIRDVLAKVATHYRSPSASSSEKTSFRTCAAWSKPASSGSIRNERSPAMGAGNLPKAEIDRVIFAGRAAARCNALLRLYSLGDRLSARAPNHEAEISASFACVRDSLPSWGDLRRPRRGGAPRDP
jgi:hypothetical protein